MRAVNLLPRDTAVKSFAANRGVAFGAAGGAALATVVLATMTMTASGALSEKQTELDLLRVQIASVPRPVVKDTSGDEALAAEKGARVGALSSALGGRIAWDRVLRQVSLVLPEDVWLTNLSAVAPTAATGATTTTPGLNLVGSTYSQHGVARFLSRLAVVPDLANVRLVSSQNALAAGGEVVQFTIVADVRAAGSGT